MSVFLRTDNNMIAFALLGTATLLAYRAMDRRDRLNRKFLSTSLIVLAEIAIETATCLINGSPEKWLVHVSAALHVCLFATAPVLTYFWFLFVYHWVVPEGEIPWLRSPLLWIPIVVNAAIALLTPAYGFVFRFDGANLYHRGALFAVASAITYFYMLLSLALALRQRRKIMRQEFIPIVVACVCPMLGGLLQSLFYGMLLMWSSCAYTLVIVCILLQRRMVQLDSMTGVWTRGSFDYYITQKAGRKDGGFGVIIADIDDLKRINDEYGHCEGDRAIKTAVCLMRDALRKTDVIARAGGDEFIAVVDCDSREALEGAVERIEAAFARHNGAAGAAYRLECSFGAALYDGSCNSLDQFLKHVDSIMYANKREKKTEMPEIRPMAEGSFT